MTGILNTSIASFKCAYSIQEEYILEDVIIKRKHFMKISRALGLFLVIFFCGMQTSWATIDGWYAGVGMGRAHGDLNRTDFTPTATSIDDSDTGFKIFSGYQVNPNFAVEAGFSNFGKIKVEGATAGEIKTKAVSLNAVGLINFSNRLGVYAKGGIYRTDRNRSSALVFSGTKKVKDENGITYSLGAQVSLSEEVAFAVDFQKLVKVSNSVIGVDDQLLTGNLIYYFG